MGEGLLYDNGKDIPSRYVELQLPYVHVLIERNK